MKAIPLITHRQARRRQVLDIFFRKPQRAIKFPKGKVPQIASVQTDKGVVEYDIIDRRSNL